MDNQPKSPGRPKFFDYDSDEFYDEIFALAYNGMTDAEIADGLQDKFGHSLSTTAFGLMKSGKYQHWTPEENERRSARLVGVLERARRKNIAIVRGRYLKAALGGIKVKSVTTVSRRLKIDGVLTDNEDIQTTTTESETPPNIQALAVWLHHHDKDWRKHEGEVVEDYQDDDNHVPTDVDEGIDISQWITQEVRAKERAREISDKTKDEYPGL